MPSAPHLDLAGEIRAATNFPTFHAARIQDVATARHAIASGKVDLIGMIEPYRTVTGYVITPVLGVIPPELPLEPHEHEVAELFEAPLAFLLDAANQRLESALLQGRERRYYEIVWNEHRIWGATAGMIVNLSRRLQWR